MKDFEIKTEEEADKIIEKTRKILIEARIMKKIGKTGGYEPPAATIRELKKEQISESSWDVSIQCTITPDIVGVIKSPLTESSEYKSDISIYEIESIGVEPTSYKIIEEAAQVEIQE